MKQRRLAVLPLFRISGFLGFIGVGFALLWQVDFDVTRALDLLDATDPVIFLVLMASLPWIGFPIAAFYLYAGAAFVWWQAWLLCVAALAINIAIAYPLAKFALKEPLQQLLARTRARLPDLNPDNQFRATFLIRGIPGVPFAVQNYLLPLLGVRFPVYFVVSLSIQSLFAAGMCAVPHVVARAGWLPVVLICGMLALLLVLRAVFVRRPSGRCAQGNP
jgi:uncharacterized membrane protein YdjX (TVP38/TMEM64 family)